MRLEIFMGPYVFLGSERLAEGIYRHMESGMTDFEKYVLLRYLGLQIPDRVRSVFRSADASVREAARRSMMAKFPKTWPPS